MGDESNINCRIEGYRFDAVNLSLQQRLNSSNFDVDGFKKELQIQGYKTLKHLIESIKLNKKNSFALCGNMNQDRLQSVLDKLEDILKKYPELDIDSSTNNPDAPNLPIVGKYYNT